MQTVDTQSHSSNKNDAAKPETSPSSAGKVCPRCGCAVWADGSKYIHKVHREGQDCELARFACYIAEYLETTGTIPLPEQQLSESGLTSTKPNYWGQISKVEVVAKRKATDPHIRIVLTDGAPLDLVVISSPTGAKNNFNPLSGNPVINHLIENNSSSLVVDVGSYIYLSQKKERIRRAIEALAESSSWIVPLDVIELKNELTKALAQRRTNELKRLQRTLLQITSQRRAVEHTVVKLASQIQRDRRIALPQVNYTKQSELSCDCPHRKGRKVIAVATPPVSAELIKERVQKFSEVTVVHRCLRSGTVALLATVSSGRSLLLVLNPKSMILGAPAYPDFLNNFQLPKLLAISPNLNTNRGEGWFWLDNPKIIAREEAYEAQLSRALQELCRATEKAMIRSQADRIDLYRRDYGRYKDLLIRLGYCRAKFSPRVPAPLHDPKFAEHVWMFDAWPALVGLEMMLAIEERRDCDTTPQALFQHLAETFGLVDDYSPIWISLRQAGLQFEEANAQPFGWSSLDPEVIIYRCIEAMQLPIYYIDGAYSLKSSLTNTMPFEPKDPLPSPMQNEARAQFKAKKRRTKSKTKKAKT